MEHGYPAHQLNQSVQAAQSRLTNMAYEAPPGGRTTDNPSRPACTSCLDHLKLVWPGLDFPAGLTVETMISFPIRLRLR